LHDFDHERFFDWIRHRDFPVFVSEYYMPDDFVCIASTDKTCTYSATKTIKRGERLFVHKRWAEAIRSPGATVQGALFD
jgi:hypothetical protein